MGFAKLAPPMESIQESLMTWSEKVIWLFFAATSIQLAFLQPYVILVPGERTNLFSGLLCFLTLVVALIFAGRGVIKLRSPEFLISAALLVLGVLSSSLAARRPYPPFSGSLSCWPLGWGASGAPGSC